MTRSRAAATQLTGAVPGGEDDWLVSHLDPSAERAPSAAACLVIDGANCHAADVDRWIHKSRDPHTVPVVLVGGGSFEETDSLCDSCDHIWRLDPTPPPALLRSAIRRAVRQGLAEALEKAEARHRTIMDALDEGVIVQDERGRVLDANPAAARVLDRPLESLVTNPPSAPVWPAREADGRLLPPERRPGRDALLSGRPRRNVLIDIGSGDDAHQWLEVSCVPVTGPTETAVVSSLRDVTARQVLHEEMQFQTELLSASPRAMMAIDLEGRVVYWNRAAEELYGWTAAEVIGRPAAAFSAANVDPVQIAEITTKMVAGESWSGDVPSIRKDGRVFPARVTDTPVRGPDGRLSAIIVTAIDATARIAAEEVNDRLAAIVASSSDAIISVGLDGRITSWNPAAHRIFGYPPEEAIGSDVFAIIDTTDDAVMAAIATVRQGHRVDRFEGHGRHREGTTIEVASMLSPIRDANGQLIGVSAIVHDITESARQAREVEESARRLALAERIATTEHFERLAAEQANAAKSTFLSHVSHELRTPLNAVLGFTQLLQLSTLDAGDTDSVTSILIAGRHLAALIDELLDVAAIEAGALRVTPDRVDILDTASEAINLVGPAAVARGVSIGLKTDRHATAWVRGDRQRIVQVMLNLLSNAVKYNQREGRVDVRVSGDASVARIDVTDDGPGICANDLERLFAPFERLGAERTDIEGIGLGLTLSRALVEQMGGRLGVTSQVGRGSTFWFEVPTDSHG